jgi:hypothetical protein
MWWETSVWENGGTLKPSRHAILCSSTAEVGHEGKEEPGPVNVLWAREHAPNEYTLLLGSGRDLITVDAAVQYRIADPARGAISARIRKSH